MGRPIQLSRCRSCGARIRWAKTAEGKTMPVDADPTETGNVLLSLVVTRAEGRVLRAQVLGKGQAAPPDRNRYVSHFATCPAAAQHRR